jgi:hypothetical protein
VLITGKSFTGNYRKICDNFLYVAGKNVTGKKGFKLDHFTRFYFLAGKMGST